MKGAWLSRDLLLEIKEYIEETAVEIDGEWGSARTLEELIQDNEMPELYEKICTLI